MSTNLESLVLPALAAREALIDADHQGAFRVFDGFREGPSALTLDVYGRTLAVHDYSEGPHLDRALVDEAVRVVRGQWPWVRSAVWKARHAEASAARNGTVVFGSHGELDTKVREDGVSYAVDLTLNRDASLYLDTRLLRRWLKEQLADKSVLNAFAYTGSLGVAARAAGARVLHVDRTARFLELGKRSYELNGFPLRRTDFRAGDFFEHLGRLRHEGALFDCVLLDPPFFSASGKGRVDLEKDLIRLVNKARPVVAHEGRLVVVCNALFVSGEELLGQFEALGKDGYVQLEERVLVPDDCAAPWAKAPAFPADPAPFNHSTKIAVLRVRRKDEARSNR